ncbi:MAG: phosphate ABC transporter permease PstA [Chloroflexi bacterium]|nr:phosphate ABC transporter permease PstA [Chloroflexota bacterium]
MSAEEPRAPVPVNLLQPDASLRRRQALDRLFVALLVASAASGVVVLLLVLGYVIWRGAPALNPAFFTQRPLPYGEPGGGVAPAILGTLTMLAVASAIGIPIGIGAAVYLSEYGRGSFANVVRFVIDLLAGLPSIVVGVFVWALVVRQLVGNYSGIAGAVALAIIMIPIVTRTVEEILHLVPTTLREASLALGVPRWRTILFVVLPTARAGIITGVVLSLARAGGETAPLLLTALGNQFFSFDLTQPMAALPVQIYNYAVSPYEDWHTKAWGSALVLIGVIGTLSLVTRLAARGRTGR